MAQLQILRPVDVDVWIACAGRSNLLPAVGGQFYYFPEGHAEHAASLPDFSSFRSLQPFYLCQITEVCLLAHPTSDEIYAKISLDHHRFHPAGSSLRRPPSPAKLSRVISFSKTLTKSDANSGGALTVPIAGVRSVFPSLDYTKMPPAQDVSMTDVGGRSWKFRLIYRGNPRRHLITTGWRTFSDSKKLVSGDTLVFIRSPAGELFVGIRRARRTTMGRVSSQSVVEAIREANMGRPFEVLYCPNGGLPEFMVEKERVEAAMEVPWGAGLRVKMAVVEDEAAGMKKKLFHGTVSAAVVPENGRWPRSIWRLLKVNWDKQGGEAMPDDEAASPWQVDLESSLPAFYARKRPRLLPHHVGGEGSLGFFFPPATAGFGGADEIRRRSSPCLSLFDVHEPSDVRRASSIFLNGADDAHHEDSAAAASRSEVSTQSVGGSSGGRRVLKLFGQIILSERSAGEAELPGAGCRFFT
ncbi:Auxin response factor 22 [Apostasia shenzhenica]|uniref:Auxin response factor n=1 Tax=Apostasia shenzhenica TaxID=1088818 RepID=A0A2I0ASA3_9ASPA|nr:Auxin response factor 22 [Apostasia shenzhenica]